MALATQQYTPRAGNVDPVGDGMPIDLRRNGVFNVGNFDSAQDAIDAAEANGGGIVFFGPGTHALTSGLTVLSSGIVLMGCGSASVISWNFNGNVVTFAAVSGGLTGCGVVGLAFAPTGARSSGWVIKATKTLDFILRDVKIGTEAYHVTPTFTVYDGIWLDRAGRCLIDNVKWSVLHDALAISGESPWHFDGVMRSCELWGTLNAGGTGVRIGGGLGGFAIHSSNIVLFNDDLKIDKTLIASANSEVFLGPSLFLDSAGDYGLTTVQDSFTYLSWSGVWACSCGAGTAGTVNLHGAGINVAPGGIVHLTGGRISNNYGTGVQYSSSDLIVTGMHIHGNGTGANGGDGISIFDTTGTNTIISGNRFATNGNGARGAGVRIATGFDKYAITGNGFYANGQLPIVDANAAGPTRVTANNYLA